MEGRALSALFRTPGGFYAAFCRFKKRLNSDDRNGRRSFFDSKTGFLSRAGTFWWQKVPPKPSACCLARVPVRPHPAQDRIQSVICLHSPSKTGFLSRRAKEDQAYPSSRSGRGNACRIFFRARRKCGRDFPHKARMRRKRSTHKFYK